MSYVIKNNLDILKKSDTGINDIFTAFRTIQSAAQPMQDFMETLQANDEVINFFKNLELFSKNLATSIHPIIQQIQTFLDALQVNDEAISFFKNLESFQQKIDFSYLNNLKLPNTKSEKLIYDDIQKLGESLKEDISKYDFEEAMDVSKEDIVELNNDLNQINGNWQKKLLQTCIKWKERNPIIFFILFMILFSPIYNLYNNVIIDALIAKDAVVRENNTYQSPITYTFKTEQSITIINNNVPYYYWAEYFDESDNKFKSGWISKRSVRILENNEIDIVKN